MQKCSRFKIKQNGEFASSQREYKLGDFFFFFFCLAFTMANDTNQFFLYFLSGLHFFSEFNITREYTSATRKGFFIFSLPIWLIAWVFDTKSNLVLRRHGYDKLKHFSPGLENLKPHCNMAAARWDKRYMGLISSL